VTRLDAAIAELTRRARERGADGDEAGRIVWRHIAGKLLEGRVADQRLDAWFGTAAWLDTDGVDVLSHSPVELGAAFERTAHLRLTGTSKRDSGMYYTPAPLAELAVSETVAALRRTGRPARGWRILDPAAGAGAFAAAAVEQVAAAMAEEDGLEPVRARDAVLTNGVFLVDTDVLAVAVARSLLLAQFGGPLTDVDALERHVVVGDAVIGGPEPSAPGGEPGAFRWAERFPAVFDDGGFDAVVGNPPWGTVKPSLREFAATIDPRLLRLESTALRTRINDGAGAASRAVAGKRRDYAVRLRAAGYRCQGAGDTEFYRYFVELAHGVLRPGGVLGMVVPSAFQRAAGAAPLRRLLLEDGAFDLWLDFINTRGIFDIHKMFRFALVVWRQGGASGIGRVSFGNTSVEDARRALGGAPVPLSTAYLSSVSPARLTIPDVRSRAEADLYARLHDSHPALAELVDGAWEVRFRRELDMTNDAALFVPADQALREGARPISDGSWSHPALGELLPVFEGRMVHQFDAAAKGHVEGHGRSARWELLGPAQKAIRPRYLIPAQAAERRRIPRAVRAVFCDVTGHANERTVLAAVVPDVAACGNKVPTCSFSTDDPDLALMWVAIANSFVVDWMARRRVSTTLNFFHWQELPFPRIDPTSAEGRRLVRASAALSARPGQPWSNDFAARAALRAQIDVHVALLYGLGLSDVALMLRDFPLLDRGAPRGHSTVTRDTVLAELAAALGSPDLRLTELGIDAPGQPERLDERLEWHSAAGAVAYVPGEYAVAVQRAA
jgi:hypothetical protein